MSTRLDPKNEPCGLNLTRNASQVTTLAAKIGTDIAILNHVITGYLRH